jgi:hypothetical protein
MLFQPGTSAPALDLQDRVRLVTRSIGGKADTQKFSTSRILLGELLPRPLPLRYLTVYRSSLVLSSL